MAKSSWRVAGAKHSFVAGQGNENGDIANIDICRSLTHGCSGPAARAAEPGVRRRKTTRLRS